MTSQETTGDRQAESRRYSLVPLADQGVLVDCGETIDVETNRWIDAAARAVNAAAIAGVTGVVPTYRSLTVEYDSTTTTQDTLTTRLDALLATLTVASRRYRRFHVPVVYGGEYGLDFDDFCRRHALSREEVIALHTAPDYRVFMIGFMPGFAYLGGLEAQLHTPRRDSPRTRTPAGSISVGGQQTAVSSVEAPSGWHLLGRTPVRTFDPQREPPILIEAGDSVRFEAIDEARFRALQADPDWQPAWEWMS
ncbi:5-oxoprolinase subunit PxpB [Salinicola avicenniae]|uniref:5-oxoprolinase subunit PxpB n=1 Tax=Salinicola avicenniae TaxID=2916836 RepID=UPI00207323A7|nr:MULTISPECIES: 5-oxoprolinase subunit PxpB [unclassified Salinicola]